MNGEKWIRITQLSLGLVATAAFFAAVIPDVRASVRGTVMKDFRTVVSTATGDLGGDGNMFTVAKIKTRNNIYLEIFSSITDGAPQLVERIELADSRDAFFNFDGQATNLAIEDVNGDGRKEILAPTFDKNLVGRLNVFEYNSSTGGFNKVMRSTL
jgi:hypothetical protein